MAGYRQSAPDRAKAGAATLLVHAAIGAVFLTGLATNVAQQRHSDALKMFDVTEPPPPPIVEVKLEPSPAPEGEAAPPNLHAKPTPVVAPAPVIPAPTPVPAAPIAGTGSESSAGASNVPGPGTGAGGNGNGLGGGGTGGSGGGFTPPVMVRKIPHREYRRLSASGIRNGTVALKLVVSSAGVPSNCRTVGTSGDQSIDALVCQLTTQYVRYRPAQDRQGRPVAWEMNWAPIWYSTRGR